MGPILDEALAERRPTIIEAVVDPFEPPMPPKVTVKQAAHLAEAMLKGTPNRKEMVATVAGNKFRELV